MQELLETLPLIYFILYGIFKIYKYKVKAKQVIMTQIDQKRRQNERKFTDWIDLPEGGRRYWFEIKGKFDWKARYVKVVNKEEETIRFYQEIYDGNNRFVEIHEKFPTDKGHSEVKE